jgi:predicted transcriptional regulator
MWAPSTIPRVQKAYELRLKGLGLTEIAKEVNLHQTTLVGIFKNPVYANKIRVKGKPPQEWPEAGIIWPDGRKDPPVSFKDWLRVQEIRDGRPLWIASREARRKKVEKFVNDILLYITQEQPTTGQIIKKFGLSAHQTDNYLRILRLKGLIEKRGGKRGKWCLLKHEV